MAFVLWIGSVVCAENPKLPKYSAQAGVLFQSLGREASFYQPWPIDGRAKALETPGSSRDSNITYIMLMEHELQKVMLDICSVVGPLNQPLRQGLTLFVRIEVCRLPVTVKLQIFWLNPKYMAPPEGLQNHSSSCIRATINMLP